MAGLDEIVARFGHQRVAVIGDVIADIYLHARPLRLSREAPVIVVRYEREETIPGGAANTVRNLAALGVHATLLGAVGRDPAGTAVVETLRQAGVDVRGVQMSESVPSVTKTRILAGEAHRTKQQLFRIDREPERPTRNPPAQVELATLAAVDREVTGWIVSDYGYGYVSEAAAQWLRERAREKPVIVDSRHRLRAFRGVTAMTPNEEEAEEAAGMLIEGPEDALAVGRSLLDTLHAQVVLLTRGKRGMMVFERERPIVELPIVGTGEVVDVSGAGDTVVAAFSAALLAGASPAQASWVANCAASVVVMKLGASTCSVEELLGVLRGAVPPVAGKGREQHGTDRPES